MTNYILEYYQAIKDGREQVGIWILLIYEYIIKGLENKLFYFDIKKTSKAIKFVENFIHHSEGRNDLLKLELWQKAITSVIFGIVDAKGLRQFREVLIVVARKNGKTLFCAALIAYCTFLDGEYGAKVYCLAPKLDQTDQVYQDFIASVDMETDLKKLVKPRKSDLYIASSKSSVKRIAFNAKKSDGFNPHLVICDEIAAWPGDQGLKQYEVMTSAYGARKQPLVVSITTAGYVNDGIYDELMKRATSFLKGNSKETRLLPFLYIIDDPTKWNDINELRKSNPNLGVSISVDYLLEQIAIAEGSLSKKQEFMTKFCNVKQNSAQAWLNAVDIEAGFGEALQMEDFAGCYAVCGVDLSQTTDLTACTCVIEKNGVLNVFAQFFLPAEKIEEATQRDGLPYQIYIQKGWLKPSGDNFVDYHDCEEWFVNLVRKYKILPLKTGYDRYTAQYLVQDMKNLYGFHMDDVYQGFNLTPVIHEAEGLIKDRKFNFGNNDLLKIHLLNSALKMDAENDKVKLIKISAKEHIDGTAALLDAMTVRQKWWGEIGRQLQNEG